MIDSKQMSGGNISLSATTSNKVIQLSDSWVSTVLSRLDDSSEAYKMVSSALRDGTLVKGVAAVDRATGKLIIARVK